MRAYSVFAGAAANVLLNLLLIPRWGCTGAVAACITSDVLIFIFLAASIRAAGVRLAWASLTFRPALATAVMAVPVWMLRHHNVALPLAAGLIAYLGAAILIQAVPRNDQQVILSFVRRRRGVPA